VPLPEVRRPLGLNFRAAGRISFCMTMLDLAVEGAQLRPWRRGDETDLARQANSRKVWMNLRDTFPHPYTSADAEQWIGFALAERPQTHFAITMCDAVAGGIGFALQSDVHRRSAEVGFWLGEEYWGRGIATAALEAVTTFALGSFDLCRLYAFVYEWNAASMRVLEKAGYGREACLRRAVVKDGRTIDQYVYALVREEEEDRTAG
jgi:ribosomal-protein-alanine N-acetyltransferase